jgi:hypothetical protein
MSRVKAEMRDLLVPDYIDADCNLRNPLHLTKYKYKKDPNDPDMRQTIYLKTAPTAGSETKCREAVNKVVALGKIPRKGDAEMPKPNQEFRSKLRAITKTDVYDSVKANWFGVTAVGKDASKGKPTEAQKAANKELRAENAAKQKTANAATHGGVTNAQLRRDLTIFNKTATLAERLEVQNTLQRRPGTAFPQTQAVTPTQLALSDVQELYNVTSVPNTANATGQPSLTLVAKKKPTDLKPFDVSKAGPIYITSPRTRVNKSTAPIQSNQNNLPSLPLGTRWGTQRDHQLSQMNQLRQLNQLRNQPSNSRNQPSSIFNKIRSAVFQQPRFKRSGVKRLVA